jgi:hypothetical protein
MSTLTFTVEATTVDPALVERRKRDRERRKPTFNPLVPQVFDWDSYRYVSELPAIWCLYAVTVDAKGREHETLVAFLNLKSPTARLTVRRMNIFRRRFAKKRATHDVIKASSFLRFVELFSAQQLINESTTSSSRSGV